VKGNKSNLITQSYPKTVEDWEDSDYREEEERRLVT
jgi:hypothetical protein